MLRFSFARRPTGEDAGTLKIAVPPPLVCPQRAEPDAGASPDILLCAHSRRALVSGYPPRLQLLVIRAIALVRVWMHRLPALVASHPGAPLSASVLPALAAPVRDLIDQLGGLSVDLSIAQPFAPTVLSILVGEAPRLDPRIPSLVILKSLSVWRASRARLSHFLFILSFTNSGAPRAGFPVVWCRVFGREVPGYAVCRPAVYPARDAGFYRSGCRRWAGWASRRSRW